MENCPVKTPSGEEVQGRRDMGQDDVIGFLGKDVIRYLYGNLFGGLAT